MHLDTSFCRRMSEYFLFIKKYPKQFLNESNSVKIILEIDKIFELETISAYELKKLNLPINGSYVGIISQDPWVSFIRDALKFSDGQCKLHTRIVNRVNDGIAVLPIYNGRIVLISHFRHPIRKSLWEIPRGGIEENSSIEETVHKELLEEIGGIASNLVDLGFIYGTTNISANGAYLFIAKLSQIGNPQISEGIELIKTVTPREFEMLIIKGDIVDSFTVAAFTNARLKNLL